MARPEWTDGREILDLVHESIFARDRDLRITFWNAAAEELYGWTRDEALGRNADELLRCVHPLSLDERESQLFATGRWQGEFTRRTKSGSEILVDVIWSVRRDEAGRPIEVVETGRDITEKRAAEEARRLSEYRFRNLFQAMAVGFCEVDFNGAGALLIPLRDAGVTDLRQYLDAHPETVREAMRLSRIVDVNDKMLSLLAGGSKEELVGSDVERFWPEASVPVFIDALVGAMEKRPHLITETRLRDLEGKEIDVLFTVSWSPESRKRGVILLGIIDIGDRKRAFEALEQSELRYRSIFNRMPIAFWQIDTRALRTVFDQLRESGVTSLIEHAATHPDFVPDALAALQITDVNDETVRMMGAPSRDALLGPMYGIWTDTEGFLLAADARFKGAETFNSLSKLTTLDGRTIDILWTAVFADEISATGTILIGAVDVTERSNAVAELARSEVKYRNLFNVMPIALWQLDSSRMRGMFDELHEAGVSDLRTYVADHPDFLDEAQASLRVTEANEQTLKLFGAAFGPAELSGRNGDQDSGRPASRGRVQCGLRRSGQFQQREHGRCDRCLGAQGRDDRTRAERAKIPRSLQLHATVALPARRERIGAGSRNAPRARRCGP